MNSLVPQRIPLANEYQKKRFSTYSLHVQYAIFCALANRMRYEERFAAAQNDFGRLINLPGIAKIGIDWKYEQLLIATEEIILDDSSKYRRKVGHLLFSITQNPATYSVSNITHVIQADNFVFAHPHALQGRQFCMSNATELVRLAINDGKISVAVEYLLAAGFMKPGVVVRSTPYGSAAIQNWPIVEDLP